MNILRRQFPDGVPILGLTATATDHVLDDVKNMLGIPAAMIFRAPFNRPNLFYEICPKSSNNALLLKNLVEMIKSRFDRQSGIIYCYSRKDTEELAESLRLIFQFLSIQIK